MRLKTFPFPPAAALLLALCLFSPSPAAQGAKITVTGSTSLLPLAQKAAEEYMALHPDVRISVAARGSGVGARALLDRLADIAASSRDLRPKELEMARERGIELVKHVVAQGGVALAVDPSNPVEGLTLQEVRDIFTGKIDNWREVGGADLDITLVGRDSNSGTAEMLASLALHGERVSPRALLLASNGAVLEAVAGNRRAIGYLGISYLTPKVKALKVDGIAPTPEKVASGEYVLSRNLYMFTPGPPQGAVADFLAFLTGPAGRRLAQENGLLPAYGNGEAH